MRKYLLRYLLLLLIPIIYLACKSTNAIEQIDRLFSAVIQNDPKEVHSLLSHGANVNCRDVNDFTPLALSSRLSRGEISALFLNVGADANVQSKMNIDIGEEGYTPLLWAVVNGDTQTLQLMLEKGGDVNKPSLDGDSSLIYAVRNGNLDIVRLLLETGANRDYKNPYSGMTALMEAVAAGNNQIVEYLIDKGVDIGQRDKNGNTLLMLAARRSRLAEVMYLAELGLETYAQNNLGDTALHLALGDLKNNLYTQEYLIKNGAIINAKNQDGITPLMEAAYRGYPKSVGLLIEMGGDINVIDIKGNAPLHFAVRGYENCEAITAYLLKSGAMINVINEEGNTPLIIASRYPSVDVISALLGYKAELNTQNKQGWSALMEAAKAGHLPIIKLLAEHGADINQVNNEGKTAATIAKEYKQFKAYEYIKSLGARE